MPADGSGHNFLENDHTSRVPVDIASAQSDSIAVLRRQMVKTYNLYGMAILVADADDATPEQEEEANRIADEHIIAVKALIAFQPTSPAELVDKAAALCSREADSSPEESGWDGLARLCGDIARVLAPFKEQACPETGAGRAKWNAFEIANQAALAEEERRTAEQHRVDEKIEAEAPIPTELIVESVVLPWTGRPSTRWHNSKTRCPPNLLGLQQDYLSRRAAVEAKYAPWTQSVDEDGDLDEGENWAYEAHLEVTDSDCALIDAQAPDVAALAYKVRRILDRGWCDQYGDNLEKPETIARLLADDCFEGAWPIVRIYQDLQRLSGATAEPLDVEPFSAEVWVKNFESFGGGFTVASNYDVRIHMELTGDVDSEAAKRMLDELTGWKRKAVLRHVQVSLRVGP